MRSLQQLIDLHRTLVEIPSVNPGFRGGSGESLLTDFLEQEAQRRGFRLHRQEVFPNRHNLYARIGAPDKPALLLEAHQDTVGLPPQGMVMPSRAEADLQRRTYGRGACDTKGSLAVFFQLFSEWAQHPEKLAYPIVFAATVDEESHQTGAFRLLEKVGPLAGAITGEPTLGDIIHAHKGSYRTDWKALGMAAHSSTPNLGDNAIYRMAESVLRLRALAAELQARPADPILGHGSLSVGVIEGGVGANIVPDSCSIYIDRRVLPNESESDVVQQITDAVTGGSPQYFEKVSERFRKGIFLPAEHPFCESLAMASTTIKGHCELIKAPFMTNATAYAAAGVPSLVFGPGSIELAHTKGEYIDWKELEQAERILRHFVEQGPHSWVS
jgi:succinyl-diaminopimelate desuccinylase